MSVFSLRPIWERIELSWSNTGAAPDYIDFVRLALSSDRQAIEAPGRGASSWGLLPGLCCQAAGGDPRWADDIAAAWFMFYLAADLMDSVEDQDEPDPWWAELGPAMAINVATGLYFSAARSLNRIYLHEAIRPFADELVDDFLTSFIRMCGGQHRDIVTPEPTLEQYWETAECKSGAFFALACRSGARLATDDQRILGNFSRFGHHLGVLIQILDDLEDIQNLSGITLAEKSTGIFRSLPVAYTMDVSPPAVQIRLKECLSISSRDPQASQEAFELIEQSGVVLYLVTEIERHKQLANDYLERIGPPSSATEALAEFIRRLGSPE